MQTFICILIIVLSVVLFWVGMVRTDPMDKGRVEAIIREQRSGNPSSVTSVSQTTTSGNATEEPLVQSPVANDRARSTLFIELPAATNRPRSRDATFSLKESYISWHKEFISSDKFLEHLSRQLRRHSETSELLAGSFADGPIPLFEILRNRLFFSLEKNNDDSESPILVVEALGETAQAAKSLAELVQREYLKFIGTGEALTNHPQLARLLNKFSETQQKLRSLENDLASFHRLNKEPIPKDRQVELRTQLASCQEEKSRQVAHLREITQAFGANPKDIGALVDLGGLAEFEQLSLLRKNLRKLESSTRKYRSEGNQDAVIVHEKTAQSMRKRLKSEIHLAIAVLKDRLQNLLQKEMALSESLAATENDFTELALRYPKAQQLQAVRRSSVALESQLKQMTATWNQARKLLRIRDLSKPLPPVYVEPLRP